MRPCVRASAAGLTQSGANFDSKFVSREAAKNAKNAKEEAFMAFGAPSLEKDSSATEFSPLRVLRGFARKMAFVLNCGCILFNAFSQKTKKINRLSNYKICYEQL